MIFAGVIGCTEMPYGERFTQQLWGLCQDASHVHAVVSLENATKSGVAATEPESHGDNSIAPEWRVVVFMKAAEAEASLLNANPNPNSKRWANPPRTALRVPYAVEGASSVQVARVISSPYLHWQQEQVVPGTIWGASPGQTLQKENPISMACAFVLDRTGCANVL